MLLLSPNDAVSHRANRATLTERRYRHTPAILTQLRASGGVYIRPHFSCLYCKAPLVTTIVANTGSDTASNQTYPDLYLHLVHILHMSQVTDRRFTLWRR